MKRTVVAGLLLGVLAAFPALAAPVVPAVRSLAAQPLLWAFCAGLIAGPRLSRRMFRRNP